MKKSLSVVLCIVIMCSCMGVSADTASARSMEQVLVSVKPKLDIPAELTEFSSNMNTYGGNVTYEFSWTEPQGGKSLSVTCDSMGRISNYHYYGDNYSTKKISAVTKQEIIDFATAFVQKTLPEAFVHSDDILVYDAGSYNARGNLRYNLTFKRCKGGIEVRNNSVQLTVYISNDKLYVSNMSAYIDYDTEYDPATENGDFEVADTYKAAFPVEKIYRDDYTYYRAGDEQDKTLFVYRIKDNNIGYILAETGDIVEPDADAEAYRFSVENSATADMAGGSSAEKNMLTQQEIAELETVENLMSPEQIKEIIKNLPYVSFENDLDIADIHLGKNADDGYYYRLYFNNSSNTKATVYNYLNATVNAKDGTVTYLSCNGAYGDRESVSLSQAQKDSADKKIGEFLDAVAGSKLSETQKQPAEYMGSDVRYNYIRMVNGIKYINNSIYVSFDGQNGKVRSYSCNFSKKEFADPTLAISDDAAYDAVLEYAPLKQIYIKHNGSFVRCHTLSKQTIELDAITGDILSDISDAVEYNYNDIENHWARNAVQKLAEIQIGIRQESFEPDRYMTQQELLQLLCGGMINKYYLDYSTEELYENLINSKIISSEEKAPDSMVTREDAFVYMIRIADLEKVAKLEDIYKVTYSDGDKISKGKIGYVAILSGMKIINGSGGAIRPADNITRAEAATMIYKYLLTF